MRYVGHMEIIGGIYIRRAELLARGIKSCGENVMVHKSAQLVDLENIEIGSNVRIDPFCTLSAAGGFIRIGNYVHIAGMSCIFGGAGVTMEDFSGLSHNVSVYSASDDYSGHHLTNPTVPKEYLGVVAKPITLGRHVIVGSGSVILPGASIGEGSAVGALSLVTKPCEPWGIYAGNPARRIKARSKELLELEARLLSGRVREALQAGCSTA
jgi:acetyltransferase-like isoleucine patch superfamily enzyme